MDSDFSLLDVSLGAFEQRSDVKALYSLANPWQGNEATEAARKRRLDKARVSFADFDRIYFPPAMYDGDYSPPNEFHAAVAAACARRDKHVTLLLGPNGHAKSATVYKWDIWAMLFGYRHFIAYAGETLDTPRAIIIAIQSYLVENSRIRFDFPDLQLPRASTEYLHVRNQHNPKGTVVIPLSTDRSARGKLVNLTERPDAIHVEDLENRTSSLTTEAVQQRRDRIEEMRNALAPHGSLTITANNFDERCLANRYLTDYEQGKLDAKFTVESYPAWGKYYTRGGKFKLSGGTHYGPLWRERFPASSEAHLRQLMGISSDADWSGGQQQRPIKPKGDFFLTEHWHTYDNLPGDLMGIVYVDPNLAKKGKGDRTCLGGLVYSQSTQLVYGYGIRYKSYGNSNDLLADLDALVLSMYDAGVRMLGVGMDGNVNQESHWSMHVSNYMRLKGRMLFPISYVHYNVEQMAKLAQSYWESGVVRMPEQWHSNEERTQFEGDFSAFTGRKLQGKRDDAPDWFVCSVQFLIERGVGFALTPVKIESTHRSRLGRMPRLGKL